MKNALTQRIKDGWAVMTGQKSASSVQLARQFLTGDDSGSGSGAEMSNAYAQSVWVYAVVDAIASQMAGIPLKVVQGQGKGEKTLEQGELVELLANPSSSIDPFAFWELQETLFQLRGEVFFIGLDKAGGIIDWTRVGGRGPKPVELVILHPDQMREVVQGNKVEGWHFTGSSQDSFPSFNFLPSEVIHRRKANPFNYFRGFSPLTVARLAAATDYASAQFQKGLMMNNADTGVIVTTDQWLDKEQREMIMAALRERKRKAGTADRPLFLGGGAKVEKPGISSADMQFLENRKYSRQEICAVWRVPQEILGYTEDANRSVSEVMKASFIENTIMPNGDRTEQALGKVGRLWGPLIRVKYDYDALPAMKAMRRSRVDTAVKLFTIGVPFNDINADLELGYPEYPWHKVGYLPYSVTPANQIEAAPKTGEVITPEVIEEDDTENTDEDPASKAIAKALKVVSGLKSQGSGQKQLTTAQASTKRAIHTCAPDPGYKASTDGAVAMFRGKLKNFFWNQRNRVLTRLESQVSGLKSQVTIQQRGWDDVFDPVNEDQLILNLLKVPVQQIWNFGVAQVGQEIGAVDLTLPPARAIEFFNERQNKITGINDTTFDALKGSLQDGLKAGESFEQLAERVKEKYKEADQARAESIAVTEVNTAVNGGRFAAMEEAEVELKGWSASNLANVRPSHLAAERDYKDGVPVSQPFRVGGFDLMFPGDPNGPAEEVINCRCFTFAVLTEKGVSCCKPKQFLGFDEFLKGKPKV